MIPKLTNKIDKCRVVETYYKFVDNRSSSKKNFPSKMPSPVDHQKAIKRKGDCSAECSMPTKIFKSEVRHGQSERTVTNGRFPWHATNGENK